jgi:hypothetical protein
MHALMRADRRRRALLDACHPKQRAFIADESKHKLAVCSRRAGKSRGVGVWLLEPAERYPGQMSVYIALSRPHARNILLPTMRAIDRQHNLGLRFPETDGQLWVVHPNGYRIWLAGCQHMSDVEKFRGPAYVRAAVDEAGSFGAHLEELVEDALDPAMLDFDGEICLTGTPPPCPAGYFYEVATGDRGRPCWPQHHWTVMDNPFLPHAEDWLRRKREANGWDENHPRYRREYLGQWIRDLGALVYPYDPDRNGWDGVLPEGEVRSGIGMDIGYEDATAWVPMQWVSGAPELYIPESHSERHLIPSVVAAYTQRWKESYPGPTVVDTGGIGKGYAEEMKQRFGVACEPAEKQHKLAAAEMMRGDLLSGVLKVNPSKNRDLLDEWSRIQWLEDRSGIDPRFPNHLADAALYIHRRLRPWYRPEKEGPTPGTREFIDADQARVKREAERAVREKLEKQARRDRRRVSMQVGRRRS